MVARLLWSTLEEILGLLPFPLFSLCSPLIDRSLPLRYFTVYAAMMGCRVKVFEPVPRTIRYLNASIIVNGLADKVHLAVLLQQFVAHHPFVG